MQSDHRWEAVVALLRVFEVAVSRRCHCRCHGSAAQHCEVEERPSLRPVAPWCRDVVLPESSDYYLENVRSSDVQLQPSCSRFDNAADIQSCHGRFDGDENRQHFVCWPRFSFGVLTMRSERFSRASHIRHPRTMTPSLRKVADLSGGPWLKLMSHLTHCKMTGFTVRALQKYWTHARCHELVDISCWALHLVTKRLPLSCTDSMLNNPLRELSSILRLVRLGCGLDGAILP